MNARAKKQDNRRAIILVHGLRGDHHGLIDIARLLQPSFRVITPDLPGYGDASSLDEVTLDTYADWLRDYIKQLDLDKPIILGHSMGSIITSHFIKKYPNLCDEKCIFLAPILRTEKEQRNSNRLYKLVNFGLHLLPGKSRYSFLKSKFISLRISHFLTFDRSQKEFIDEQHLKYSGRFASADGLMSDIEISMCEQTVIPSGKHTLIIIGAHDRLTKVEVAKSIARKKHVKFVTLKNCGHLFNYERPKAAAAKILAFFDEPTNLNFDDSVEL